MSAVEVVPVGCGWSAGRLGLLSVNRGDCSSRFSWKADDIVVFGGRDEDDRRLR
jgi:hypothetical protein